jgi:hypothetical protein
MATRDELTALRPGAALRVMGDGYLIERTVRCQQDDGAVWWEHRLSSDGAGRSLWLEIPEDLDEPLVAHESTGTLGAEPDGGPEIEYGGERIALLLSARASYRSVERSAAPKSGELVYHEYASGDRRVTYERRGEGGVWEVSAGREIDAASVEVLEA